MYVQAKFSVKQKKKELRFTANAPENANIYEYLLWAQLKAFTLLISPNTKDIAGINTN